MLTVVLLFLSFIHLSILYTQGEYTRSTWEEKSQEINFADFKFYITHYVLVQDQQTEDVKDNVEEGNCIVSHQHFISKNKMVQP